MKYKLKRNSGFTLIELLVTISIILLMTGAGIAGFVNFNDRQQVQTTVNELKDYMRAAQIKARAGEGADSCTGGGKLYGYRVSSDASNVYLRKICKDTGGAVTNNVVRSQFALDKVTVTRSPNVNVTFLTLKGGVDTNGNASITYTVTGQYSTVTQAFQVFQTGEIKDVP